MKAFSHKCLIRSNWWARTHSSNNRKTTKVSICSTCRKGAMSRNCLWTLCFRILSVLGKHFMSSNKMIISTWCTTNKTLMDSTILTITLMERAATPNASVLCSLRCQSQGKRPQLRRTTITVIWRRPKAVQTRRIPGWLSIIIFCSQPISFVCTIV